MANRRATHIIFPIGILVAGAAIMAGLSAMRKSPARERTRPSGVLVETVTARVENRRVLVEGTGEVSPRHEATLTPQVSGRVVWVSPDFKAGGRIVEGRPLLRIEDADYRLALERAESQVAQAEYQLEVAQANASIAQREWELMARSRDRLVGTERTGDGNAENGQTEESGSIGQASGAGPADADREIPSPPETATPDPLVLHKPQLKQAEAGLAAAKAAVEAARLNLDRTTLRAPFNGRVRSESVSPGQLVGPNTPVGAVYSTDLVEVEIGLPQADLAWIEVPGSPAAVTLDTGEGVYQWPGRVDRTVGVLARVGRLATVVVEVPRPDETGPPDAPELAMGSFVTVGIEGRQLEGVVVIPRAALRENSLVWVARPDTTLEIRQAQVRRLAGDEVLLGGGVEDGERVVLTPISGAVTGMRLRLVDAGLESDPSVLETGAEAGTHR